MIHVPTTAEIIKFSVSGTLRSKVTPLVVLLAFAPSLYLALVGEEDTSPYASAPANTAAPPSGGTSPPGWDFTPDELAGEWILSWRGAEGTEGIGLNLDGNGDISFSDGGRGFWQWDPDDAATGARAQLHLTHVPDQRDNPFVERLGFFDCDLERVAPERYSGNCYAGFDGPPAAAALARAPKGTRKK